VLSREARYVVGRRGVARWAPVVVVPVLLSGLSGCGGEDEPEPIMPSQSPTTSASPSEVAETEPEIRDKRTEAGAVGAAERWLLLAADASNSGDTATLRAATGEDCEDCATVLAAIDDTYADGGRIQTERPRILSIGDPVAARDDFSVPIQIRKPVERVIDAKGQEQVVPATNLTFEFRMQWNGERWLVGDLSIVA
jgi:hypothetical protein